MNTHLKTLLLSCCLFLLHPALLAQSESVPLYHPDADAAADIAAAETEANESGKHVFLQIGGNWCGWCIKFHKYIEADTQLDSIQQTHFVVRKVNYSRENKNEAVLADLEFPQRFGFPVFVILDGNGRRIHTQNSGLLESGDGYDPRKIREFFLQWSPAAIHPETYQK